MIPVRVLVVAFVAACLGVLMLLSGCTASAAYTGALKVKQVASDTIVAGYDGWRLTDRGAQDIILGQSKTYEEYQAKIGDWRRDVQNEVDDAFVDARDALTAYSKALDAAGAAQVKDYSDAISKVMQALERLHIVLARHGVTLKIPALPTIGSRPHLYVGRLQWAS